MIKVKHAGKKGRCVVATQFISLDTLIECAPASKFSTEQRLHIADTEVFQYFFVQPKEYEQSQSANGYLVFGLSSLCSHHENPNAYIEWVEDKVGWWARLISKTAIEAGDEVTLYYTNIGEYRNRSEFV